MRLYEIVYIFDPNLTEDSVSAKLEGYHELLTGGEVTAIDHWGSRQLAYPIMKQKSGYYVIVHARATAESLPEFERKLTLDEELMRYLIVVNEGEPTDGKSLVLERPVRERDDDDDDDDHRPAPPVPEVSSEAPPAEGSEPTEGVEGAEGVVAVVVRRGPPEFSGGMGRRRRVDGPPIELLNYKDVSSLSRFMTEQGKILPKRTTKVTARLQRQLGRAIKRARYLALVPYVRDHEV
jgi:small subunit ribosomal protein S6